MTAIKKTRKPSVRQLVSLRKKRAEQRVAQLERRVYRTFRSETTYQQMRDRIPADAVSTTLGSRWGLYIGYAPKEEGERLLRRMELAERILARRKDQWEATYHPVEHSRKKIRNQEASELRDETPADVRWDWLVEHGMTAADATARCYRMEYLGTVPPELKDSLSDALEHLRERGRCGAGNVAAHIDPEANGDGRHRVYSLVPKKFVALRPE